MEKIFEIDQIPIIEDLFVLIQWFQYERALSKGYKYQLKARCRYIFFSLCLLKLYTGLFVCRNAYDCVSVLHTR